MTTPPRILTSQEHTKTVASQIAPLLGPGDCILLEGPIGAGKSHFARSLILALLPVPEDVPSPTFTLVQTYDAGETEIWHADLYRLTNPDEIFELGLEEALDTAICLIEWPDRMGSEAPENALTLTFDPLDDPDARLLTATATDPKWDQVIRVIRD